ncbi:MAG: hypothetical protein KAJ07_04740 [Planctomycetes bacterium]|nr:hypothetical protein [Planctomycetota bacterium]
MIGSIRVAKNPVTNSGPVSPFTVYADLIVENSYEHEIRAMGGFWRSSFDILGTFDELRFMMLNSLGADVKSYSESSALAFHGYVHQAILRFPGGQLRFRLDGVGNSVWSRYLAAASGGDVGSVAQDYNAEEVARLSTELEGSTSTARSTKQNDLVSQAKYGIIDHVLSGGISSSGVADNQAQNYLAVNAFPKPSFEFADENINPGSTSLEFIVYGYYRTLDFRMYFQTASPGNANASDVAGAVIADVGQFIDSSRIVANTLQISQVYDTDRRASNILFDIARRGDASNNRHVIGVYENREIIYQAIPDPATSKPEYYRALGESNIKKDAQYIIPGPEVRPGKWLRITGLFPYRTSDYSSLYEDPSVQFIEAVTYSESNGLEFTSSPDQSFEMSMSNANAQSISNL